MNKKNGLIWFLCIFLFTGILCETKSVLGQAVDAGFKPASTALNPAPANPVVPNELRSLIQALLETNPEIRASREKALAAEARISVEKAWADPMIGFMVMPNPTPDMEMLSGARNTSLSQMIPVAGQKRLAGRMARNKFKMEQADLSVETLRKIEELRVSYEELAYLDEAVNIIRENRNVLDQISGMAISNESPPALLSEIQRIQTQLSQIGYDEALLRELRVAELAKLNSLLNRPPDQPVHPADLVPVQPPPASLSALMDQARKNQPELKMAEIGAHVASQEIAMARKERTPDLTFGLTQQRSRNWQRDNRADTFLFDLNLPIWSKKNRGRIQEAVHKKAEASAKLEAARNRFSTDITAQYVRIQNLWRTIQVYEGNLLPQAAHALEVSQTVSKGMEGKTPEALEAQAVWLNFQLAHRRALADYRQAMARLDTLLGKEPSFEGSEQ